MVVLINFSIILLVLLIGFDLVTRSAGPRVHSAYRRTVSRVGRYLGRQISRFARFVWARYHQFILGVVSGVIFTLYFLNRL